MTDLVRVDEMRSELVATSLIGVEQLSETIHEFLDLTRIEAGELRLNLEPLQVGSLIAEALRRVEGTANAKGITLHSHGDEHLPKISADALRLRAVFDNILSNAVKYTPNGGRITVACDRLRTNTLDEPDLVRISITDTGPGIPAAFRARIFEKFFRLEHHQTTARSAARGAGIGLYMARQIVELHGGDITCGSGPDDRGTCIAVTLRSTVRNLTGVDEAAAYVRH